MLTVLSMNHQPHGCNSKEQCCGAACNPTSSLRCRASRDEAKVLSCCHYFPLARIHHPSWASRLQPTASPVCPLLLAPLHFWVNNEHEMLHLEASVVTLIKPTMMTRNYISFRYRNLGLAYSYSCTYGSSTPCTYGEVSSSAVFRLRAFAFASSLRGIPLLGWAPCWLVPVASRGRSSVLALCEYGIQSERAQLSCLSWCRRLMIPSYFDKQEEGPSGECPRSVRNALTTAKRTSAENVGAHLRARPYTKLMQELWWL
jgi:hypothetical protein